MSAVATPITAARTEQSVLLLNLLIVSALCLGGVILLHVTPAAAAVTPDTETSGGGVLMRLQDEMLVLKEQLKLMLSAFPDLLSVGPFIASRLTKDYEPNFIWTIVLRTIGIFAGASLGELVLDWRLFRPLHQRLPDHGEQSDFSKLGALLVHGLIRLIELSAFGVMAIVLFLILYQGHEAARYAFWTLFSFVMIQRATAIGWRLLLAPYLPGLRLPALDDRTARRLYRHFQCVTGLTIGSGLAGTFLYNIGLPVGLTLAASTVLASLGTIVIIVAIWRDRRAIGRLIGIRPNADAAIRRDLTGLFAAHWHIFAICFVLAGWIIALVNRLLTNEVQVDRVVATLSLLVVVPLVDGFARMLVRHFFGASSGEAESQFGPAVREAASKGIENAGFDGVILRNVRIALGVVATILIGRIWQISLSSIAPGALEARIAEAMFQIIVTLLLASSAWSVIKIAINRHAPHETLDALALVRDTDGGTAVTRLETLLPLIRKFLFVTIVAIVLMSVVSSLGVNIGPLLAGAGIVGIAIGFGAQTLVRDILSGIFFLIDDAFRVGEYIDVGEGKGTVEHMSIRALMLRHQRGAVYTVPFGAVRRIANYSRDWSISKLDIRVPFDTDIEKVRRVVKKLGEDMAQEAEFKPYFLEPLKSQGVNRIDDSAFVLRVKFMTRPNDQFLVQREVYCRLQRVFQENGIEFASRRVVVEASGREADIEAAGNAAAANVTALAPTGGSRSLS